MREIVKKASGIWITKDSVIALRDGDVAVGVQNINSNLTNPSCVLDFSNAFRDYAQEAGYLTAFTGNGSAATCVPLWYFADHTAFLADNDTVSQAQTRISQDGVGQVAGDSIFNAGASLFDVTATGLTNSVALDDTVIAYTILVDDGKSNYTALAGQGAAVPVDFAANATYNDVAPADVAFFKVVYRRHSNFSMEDIEQTRNKNTDFREEITASIRQNSRQFTALDVPGFVQYWLTTASGGDAITDLGAPTAASQERILLLFQTKDAIFLSGIDLKLIRLRNINTQDIAQYANLTDVIAIDYTSAANLYDAIASFALKQAQELGNLSAAGGKVTSSAQLRTGLLYVASAGTDLSNVTDRAGNNVYSFALRPEEHQPSGTSNFFRIDNLNFDPKKFKNTCSDGFLLMYLNDIPLPIDKPATRP